MEYETLSGLMDQPSRPYVAILSGAKVETKVSIINSLLKVVDKIAVGGIIANTFLAAQGYCAKDKHRPEDIEEAERILALADDRLILPIDVVVSSRSKKIQAKTVKVQEMEKEIDGIWDLGPKTIERYLDICKEAKTVMWNGPVGKFEDPVYEKGTFMLAEGLAKLGAKVVVGGGDTVHALERLKLVNEFHHVSVGGGAMIALLEGSAMPGLDPLFVKEA